MSSSFFPGCLRALMAPVAAAKAELIAGLGVDPAGFPDEGTVTGAPARVAAPGRPDRPLLVHPRKLPQRKLSTKEGRATFLHALAHIEFNAINLALDAAYRFRGLPQRFYADWLSVAADEARHFELLRGRLQEMGHDYGDFAAHNGLWDMALRTDQDVLLRMALVPCVFEARGLDVTPPMIGKLERIGDHESAAVLRVILAEEVGHVTIGNRWFRHACTQRDLDPEETLLKLLAEYLPGRRHGPFNYADRRAAGFSDDLTDRIGAL